MRMIRERREQRRKQAIPAALWSIVHSCKPENIPEDLPRILQIPPRRRTARSRFVYPAELGDFGISPEDWTLFTKGFEYSASISWIQVLVLLIVALPFTILSMGLPVPANLIVSLFDPTILLYYTMKKRNTRKRVKDGIIPTWIAYWNMTYFGPKGLAVGFDLPGCIFKDAEVVPKPHKTPWNKYFIGPLRKPMSKRRIARRPRVTVAFIHEPRPQAGQIPGLKIRVPLLQQAQSYTNRNPLKVVKEHWAVHTAAWARLKAAKASNDRLEEQIRAGTIGTRGEVAAESQSEEHVPPSSEVSSMTTLVNSVEHFYSSRFVDLLNHANRIDEVDEPSPSV